MAYDGFKGRHEAGVNNVGSYQVSGIPWVSASIMVPAHSDTTNGAKGVVTDGSTAKVSFPFVTKFVTVRHDPTGSNYIIGANNGIRVGFSEAGVAAGPNRFYVELSGSESITMEVKCTELYLVSCNDKIKEATVIAGLTGIRSARLSGSSGANYSGSTGVG